MSAETKHEAYVSYLYELAWILPSVALPTGMLAALLVTAFGAGIHLPGSKAASRWRPSTRPRRSTSPASRRSRLGATR